MNLQDLAPTARDAWLRHDGWFAAAIYLIASLWMNRGSVGHLASVCGCDASGDPLQFTWAFAWFPHALFHGQSLLHSRAMWTPQGINLAAAAGAPFLAFLFAPVTALWGVTTSVDLATIFTPVVDAWAAYRLCRYVTKAPAASTLAGATFGFGTYAIAQGTGHLDLALFFAPPLVALCVLKMLDNDLSKPRFVVFTTALLLAQMFTSTEIVFTLTVVGGLALLAGMAFATPGRRSAIVFVLPWLALVGVLTLALSSVYWINELRAPAYAKGSGLNYPTDLLSFVIPYGSTWIGTGSFTAVAATFKAGFGETNAYIGLPLLLIVLTYISSHWRERVTRFLAALLIATTLWVLGSHLYIAGQKTIWLPYSLFVNLPGFNQILQGRVAMYVALGCALVLALWLSDPHAKCRAARWLAGVVALAFLLPTFMTTTSNANRWQNAAFFRTAMYKRYIHPGDSVLPIRWALSASLLWQAEDHFSWNLASGYFMTSPQTGWNGLKIVNDLWFDTPQPGDGPLLRQLLIEKHVADVVVEPAEMDKWRSVLAGAGLHITTKSGGITLYRVPRRWLS